MLLIYIALSFFILSASIFILIASYWLYIECKTNKVGLNMFDKKKAVI